MKIEEIKKKYRDMWVLIKVLEVDELGQPISGEVVAYSKSRKKSMKSREK